METSRILVVEDNTDNMSLIRFVLEREGFEVISAKNGVEGLELARQQLPDLILMDMALPELDGWTAVKELKNVEPTRSIPVIAITAYTLPADRQRAMDAGCDAFIAKPMNVVSFIKEVKAYLKK